MLCCILKFLHLLMKRSASFLLVGSLLFLSAQRMPAPIADQTPTPTPEPKAVAKPVKPENAPKVVQQSSGDWHTFTDPTGHFSFLVPGEPKRQTQKDESHNEGPIVTDTYVVNTQTNAFIAGLTQYPPAASLPDQEELTADRDNFNKAVKATVVSEERRNYAGFPAVEFKAKSEQANFHALMVKADHHVYCTVAVYKTTDEPVECGRFVSSLKLINP
jgi:hypothetical protein